MTTIIPLSCPPAFGFETQAVNYEMQSLSEYPERELKFANYSKLIGYIPVIGTFVGAFRIYHFRKETSPNKVNQIIRGVIECLCLGILLAIPDLTVTAYRSYKASQIKSATTDKRLGQQCA